ncbi:MAG: GNAT family protein [Candidatus Cohnella colombiensis]|uniref:GNAT family protein n=1 Tax=Candidatus Cohnella colombiensis TaxID=3121368 RepID=A0AA95EZS6_9BACL|nr:MAG: GNAT family protein [Cohnella sp.]
MPHLYGERIILREYRREDLPWIRQWVNDPAIVSTLSDIFLYPQGLDSTESYLEAMIEGDNDRKGFVIAERGSEDYLGQVNLDLIDWKNRTGRIGVVIGSSQHLGIGIGTEAMKVLIAFSFMEMNLNRLELEVYDFNERAYNCYVKSGFKEEGRLRQRYYRNGKYADVIMMGLLRSEWEAGQ